MTRGQPEPAAAGFVLAGGRSSRMGRDKALVDLGGRSLARHAVDLLRGAGLNPAIVGARSAGAAGSSMELAGFAPVIADEALDEGPLRGICSALASKAADGVELAVFVPVDLPLLPVSLLAYLVRHAGVTGGAVTLVSLNGFSQTFPVVIRTETRPLLLGELESGRSGCFAAFRAVASRLEQPVRVVAAEILAQAGQVADERLQPPFRWFLNVNTPEDAERAGAAIA